MEWFYANNSQQSGPVSEVDFGKLVRTGVVSPETLVWREGMKDWQPYREVAPSEAPLHVPPPIEDSRFCNSCGNRFPASELAMFGDSAVCINCKPAYVQRLAQGMASTTPQRFEYGGFWVRVVAALIDGIILSIVRYAITIPLGLEAFGTSMSGGNFFSAWFGLAALLSYAIQIGYYVYFWSQTGATPGKSAMGLKVVRPDGGMISVGQAFGRYFCQFLDAITLGIGYMMAGWDSEKRTLHDRICETRVIRTR
jgi:uncharacterized RDD family membrane protein YckC